MFARIERGMVEFDFLVFIGVLKRPNVYFQVPSRVLWCSNFRPMQFVYFRFLFAILLFDLERGGLLYIMIPAHGRWESIVPGRGINML